VETPEIHQSTAMQNYIQAEVEKPAKQWIYSVINGAQECNKVAIDHPDFILLPNSIDHYSRQFCAPLNWLAIFKDCNIRTLRDLRAEHIPIIEKMLNDCLQKLEKITGVTRSKIMAYIHYPPSVYQLHVHFTYPYGRHNHKDAFRIHSVVTISHPFGFHTFALTLPFRRFPSSTTSPLIGSIMQRPSSL
jgi:hypothetical protein